MSLSKLLKISSPELSPDPAVNNAPAALWHNMPDKSPDAATSSVGYVLCSSSPLTRDPGNEMPHLDDATLAMLIMFSGIATWLGYYWHVVNRKTHKATNIPRDATVETWQKTLLSLSQSDE